MWLSDDCLLLDLVLLVQWWYTIWVSNMFYNALLMQLLDDMGCKWVCGIAWCLLEHGCNVFSVEC